MGHSANVAAPARATCLPQGASAAAIPSPVLDTPGAAAYVGLSVKTLEAWRCTGKRELPYLKIGRRVLYRVADLDAWLGTHVRRTTSERAA